MSHAERGLRDDWGDLLVRLGRRFRKIVVLDADVGAATRADRFAAEFPDRYLQLGCAEQNLVSAAAGIATMGLIPVTSLFASFCSRRACDQVSLSVALPRLNVKLCGSYAGLTSPNTGATHQSVDDINIMRGIPNMVVIEAADAVELEQAMEVCVRYDGPTYLRIVRSPCEPVTPNNYRFQIGKPHRLREGCDITLFASGMMVAKCLGAAKILASRDISAEVINVSTIKPLGVEAVVDSARKTRRVMTVENHSINGGLGSAVAEALAENCPVPLRRIGIQDRFGASGQLPTLLKAFGLTVENIALEAERWVRNGLQD